MLLSISHVSHTRATIYMKDDFMCTRTLSFLSSGNSIVCAFFFACALRIISTNLRVSVSVYLLFITHTHTSNMFRCVCTHLYPTHCVPFANQNVNFFKTLKNFEIVHHFRSYQTFNIEMHKYAGSLALFGNFVIEMFAGLLIKNLTHQKKRHT